VRLDHLLSKEHWRPLPARPPLVVGKLARWVSRWPLHGRVCRGGCSRVEHRLVGAVTFVSAHQYRPVPSLEGVVVERGSGGCGRCLARCWVLKGRTGFGSVFLVGPGPGFIPHPLVGVGGRRGVGCRLYVENYTVDASIFVAKFLRAHGGCLGTRNR
jgi:hypothetical protein